LIGCPRYFPKGIAVRKRPMKKREALLKKIGELTMELDWLQKKFNTFPLKRGKDL